MFFCTDTAQESISLPGLTLSFSFDVSALSAEQFPHGKENNFMPYVILQ